MRRIFIALVFLCVGGFLVKENARSAGWMPLAAIGCTQSNSFLNRISTDQSHRSAYIAFICGSVNDGFWSTFDVVYLFATDTSNNAIINLVSTSFTASIVNSPTFTSNAGFNPVYNASISNTGYLNTNFNASTSGGNYSQNSAHLSVCSIETGGSHYTSAVIDNGTGTSETIYPKLSDSKTYMRINDSPLSAGFPNAGNTTGHWLGNRSGSTARQGFINAVSIGSYGSQASAAPTNNTFNIGANGSGGGYDGLMLAASIGGSMTSAQVSQFYTRLNTYLVSVRGSSC